MGAILLIRRNNSEDPGVGRAQDQSSVSQRKTVTKPNLAHNGVMPVTNHLLRFTQPRARTFLNTNIPDLRTTEIDFPPRLPFLSVVK